jgi:hypothetical protein
VAAFNGAVRAGMSLTWPVVSGRPPRPGRSAGAWEACVGPGWVRREVDPGGVWGEIDRAVAVAGWPRAVGVLEVEGFDVGQWVSAGCRVTV